MKYLLLLMCAFLIGCTTTEQEPLSPLEQQIEALEDQIEITEEVLDLLKEEQGNTEMTEVTLYFGDLQTIIDSDCSATIPVPRTIPTQDYSPEQVLEILLSGVTTEESEQGLSDSFSNEDGFLEDVEALKEYFQGVSVFDGVAFVDFAPPAMAYLNNAACMQATVKWPIIRTLQEFPEIQEVEFSINGDVVTEWDA